MPILTSGQDAIIDRGQLMQVFCNYKQVATDAATCFP